MILIGELSLWVAILMAAWASIASFGGSVTRRTDLIASGQRATWAACVFTALACAGVVRALTMHDLSMRLVAESTTLNLPAIYAVSALWSGPRGPALLWALALSLCSAGMVWVNRRRWPALLPVATGVLGLLTLGLLLATVVKVNPYVRLDWITADGLGLDPRLQHPALLFHAPLLALGGAATAVPLALLFGAIVAPADQAQIFRSVHAWTVLAWCLLGVGMLLGTWWAYGEVTEPGYWAWHSARNGSLVVWLAITVMLHTLARHRGRTGRPAEAATTPPVFATPTLARLGGHVSHAGALVLLAACVGLAFRSEQRDVTVAAGEAYETVDPWGDRWRFASDGISNYEALNRNVTALSLRVSRNDVPVGTMLAEQRQYLDAYRNVSFDPTTEMAVLSTLREDVQVSITTLVDVQTAVVHVRFNPLMPWFWIGGILLLFGGAMVLWPAMFP